MSISLIKLPEVRKRRAEGTTSIYEAVKNKLLTPPIKLGSGRASAWPAHEIDAVTAAQIAGKSKEEIRQLVAELLAARATLLPSFMASLPISQAHAAA